MFNSVTADYIKEIPSVDGVDIDHLPQMLSKIYAHILGMRTKYAGDVLQFPAEELEQDREYLGKLSLALEVYLESGQFESLNSSIAYVAAMCHKLLAKIAEPSAVVIDKYDAPPELVALLLFIIGHYFADAEETAGYIKWNEIDNPSRKDFVMALCYLAQGRLGSIIAISDKEVQNADSIEERAESLLWKTLTGGIVHLARVLSGNDTEFDATYFDIVTELSLFTFHFQRSPLRHVYPSLNRLSRLLKMASKILIEHATVKIESRIVVKERWSETIRKIAHKRPYLWDNHLDAINKGFLIPGISSVITFPTGAGKSTLVELKIIQTVLSGGRVVYIVPTHALEYQVVRNITTLLGIEETEGLNFGGEFTTLQEEDAPVWVMTPERCTTIMTLNPSRFDDVQLVVMDEFHIISSKDKGGDHRSLGAMLCLLSFFLRRPNADYVLISAMVENGEEISNWISDVTGRECLNLSMPWKPTSQLQGCLMYKQREIDELITILDEARSRGKTKAPGKADKEMMKATPYCLFSLKSEWDSSNMDDFYLVPLLDKKLFLSADKNWYVSSNKNAVSMQLAAKFASLGMKSIVFIDRPSIALTLAKQIQDLNLRTATPTSRDKKLFKSISIELGGSQYSYISEEMNVAVHHAGLLREERWVMESYFKGTIDVMAATPTLAQGVNLPVDVVIIAGEMRFDQDKGRPVMISAEEILNATGRAGRAGFSSQGASILVPSHVIGYQDAPTSRDWYAITDEIFAKGDQCLTVDDPINKMLADVLTTNSVDSIQHNTLLKINSFKEDGEKMFSNALFAYRLRTRNREQAVEQRIKKIFEIADLVSDEETEESWIKEVSFKTGVTAGVIQTFKSKLDSTDMDELLSSSVQDLIRFYCSWLAEAPHLFEHLFFSDTTVKKMRKLFEGGENRDFTVEGIKRMETLLLMFVEGATFLEMNNVIGDPAKPELLVEARTFVLKVLPLLSYALSTLSLTILEYALNKGYVKEFISDEVVNFASYLKEGVTSSGMLRFKMQEKLMRVECHRAYNS